MWTPPWRASNRLGGLTDDPAFRRWFGNSVVRNADGTPKVVYHSGSFDEHQDRRFNTSGGVHFGTERAAMDRMVGKVLDDAAEGAEVFADGGRYYLDLDQWPEAPESGFQSDAAARTWVSGEVNRYFDPSLIEGTRLTAAYLRIERPVRLKDQNNDWARSVALAKSQGYDGIVYRNEYEDRGSDSYIVFDPRQIKSVNNRGTFNPRDFAILHGGW